ncbi:MULTISPECIES: S-layer homology domain-containing protein [unclassified Enterococcus]|uniref:S-layer homology domain-containing protein n=1 Tax=unclassified Enterococcus TaxID=2608891 RepID=UPI001555C9F3|nr:MULTISPECIES: S-layer homology domain-containing protein [unclassified Enterococcus]MBS7577663.1 S-layer homology domain-containing protein [Enterococcus sp. MMGLQ5-2]MBS7584143.1 S-layer homology domain-containing protein [Enterococcus sp. MMGLQ5-1]NPD12001.1 hypothetical protein [Enterococcus sp. MMGLQ5-1]NPD37496.1 hypothetical protein [Enterococcus sp. MMGLQ5-2]
MKEGSKLFRIFLISLIVSNQCLAIGSEPFRAVAEALNPEPTGAVAHYPLNKTTEYNDSINSSEVLPTGSNVTFNDDYVSLVNNNNANEGHIAGDTPASAKVSGDYISFTFDAKLNATQSRNTYTQDRAMFIYGGKTDYLQNSISIRPYWNRDTGKSAVVIRQANSDAIVAEFDLPAADAWHNYALSLDGGNDGKLKLWVDGTKVVEVAANGIGADEIGNSVIRLNRWGMNSNPNLDLHYRDLRIYNVALPDETVASVTNENLDFSFEQLKNDLGFKTGDTVKEHLKLISGNGISWTSTDETAISTSGVVTRGATAKNVNLTVSYRGKAETYALKVPKQVEGKEITIDGSVIDTENTFKGFGTVTCNNTSRLLLDYKEEHPTAYWEIMNKLFNPTTGAGIDHIKVELGADVNSSSGAEPATMRYLDEPANVVRGAGFTFANDAKTINPHITTEILRWGEPRFSWNGSKNTDYSAKYAWYKNTIDAVKAEFGWSLDYVGLSQNERAQNNNKNEDKWLIYYLEQIKKESNYEQDYKNIKYVASDGYRDTKTIASLMNNNALVKAGIDVISYHYGLSGSAELTALQNSLRSAGEKTKEVWVSEGIAPMINSRYRLNMEPQYGGVGGTAGTVDVVQRIGAAYSWAGETTNPLKAVSFDFQPAVAAFYEGSSYNPKHLISAYDPWSGFYEEDSGISGVRQVMNFANTNHTRWQYLPEATFNDGNHSDGGIAAGSGTHNYLTLKSPDSNDYSTIYTNNTANSRTYTISAQNLAGKENSIVQLWETRGPDQGQAYDANWLQNIGSITPEAGVYTITVKPYSILTVTTLAADVTTPYQAKQVDISKDTILALPYTDDFEYSDYVKDDKGRDYVERRGGTPRYTTDQNGAFEVTKEVTYADRNNSTSYAARKAVTIPDQADHANVLQQKITTATVGAPWGVWGGTDGADTDGTSYTWLGDHRWTNYKYSFDALLDMNAEQRADRKNFVLLGVRQLKGSAGYEAAIYADGKWELKRQTKTVESGTISDFDNTKWHNYAIEANENQISFFVDGKKQVSYVDTAKTNMSGRVTIGSGYYETLIDNLRVDPIDTVSYESLKIDSGQGKIYSDLATAEDDVIAGLNELNPLGYVGAWTYKQSGYAHYNRTLTETKTDKPVWSGTTITFGDKTEEQGTANKVYYSGTWQTNASRAWSTSDGAAFEMKFTGVDAKVYGVLDQNSGTADVYLDDKKIDSIQYLNNSEIPQMVWSKEGLDYKEHTLKIVSTKGSINFTKAEFTSNETAGAVRSLAPTALTHIQSDEELGNAENTVYAYRGGSSNWGSQASNAWAAFTDNPYLVINFTGTGIDFKANTSNTAYKFELDGVDVGNHGPGDGVIYSARGLEERAHTLKVSLGDNQANTTYMDYRGVSIYYSSAEIETPNYFVFKFKGAGFSLFGNTSAALLSVSVDNVIVDNAGKVAATGDRLNSYVLTGLSNQAHTAKVEVIGGTFQLDGIDITGVDAKDVVDKTALETLYAANKDKAKGNYTDASWAAFTTARDSANKVLENAAASQEEVDNAHTALNTAVKGLVEKEIVDKTALQELYDANKDKVKGNYTASSWKVFTDALQSAKAILDKVAATKAEVATANNALEAAIEALVEKPSEALIFDDVVNLPDAEAKAAIKWLLDNKVTTGYADTDNDGHTIFGVNDSLTRLQTVLFLYRLAGSPKAATTTAFPDLVDQNDEAKKAVNWAKAAGITTGYGNGYFGPNDKVTREQFAAFLYREAGEPEVVADQVFVDVPASNQFAKAITWLAANNIAKGYGNIFGAKDNVIRQHAALFLKRFDDVTKK